MITHEMQLLYQPDPAELRFLPEGPHPIAHGRFSWVTIQHSATAVTGSLHVFDLNTVTNTRHLLPGRPGFAFATTSDGVFVVGLERCIGLYDVNLGTFSALTSEVDADQAGTLINDAVCFDGGLVFGCKDLKFAENKAGLYLYRSRDQELIKLRGDQICSNGKIIFGTGDVVTLIDIDTPTQTIVRYSLDVAAGKLSEAEIIVDMRGDKAFPDGMIATPDGKSVIVSMYNPNDAPAGETRQYSLESGKLEAVWQTPFAPQATCPQLVKHDGKVKLVVTTAIEHMTAERLAVHHQSGCLFIADTDFDSLPSMPLFPVP